MSAPVTDVDVDPCLLMWERFHCRDCPSLIELMMWARQSAYGFVRVTHKPGCPTNSTRNGDQHQVLPLPHRPLTVDDLVEMGYMEMDHER